MQCKNSKRTTTRLKTLLTVSGLMISTLTLTNCSKVTLGSESECKLFAPIYDSEKDTTQTRIEIRVHNDIGAQVCGWKPKK